MRSRLSLLCALFLVVAGFITAQDSESDFSFELHMHLSGLTKARAPEVVANHLVLSSQGLYRSVAAVFSHENWSSLHRFQVNSHGVFILALPLPFGSAQTIQYRLVLDGLWTVDPFNPARSIDRASGLPVSLADLPDRSMRVYGVWHPSFARTDNTALFYFQAAPGQRVSLAGSFNNWDPFLHELAEVRPGHYELELSLQPGTHYYSFVYQGRRLVDPLNKQQAMDPNGRPVSVLTIRQP